MKNNIYLIGEVGYEITLKDTIEKVENSDREKPLNVFIHSEGGGVFEGLAIYNYLKGLPQQVNTSSSGLVASIASIIFLAGNKSTRKINRTDSFLIHLPSNMGFGNAEDLEKTANELRKIEVTLSNIYEIETNLTKEAALELMKKDEIMDVTFLKENGFVNEIVELKAVAKLTDFKIDNSMSKKENEKTTLEQLSEKFDAFLNKMFPVEKAKNKILQDAAGIEIDFTELADDETPSIGDMATVDGSAANGDYVMPSGETFQFENGELIAIVAVETEDDTEEMATLKQELEDLKTELATAEALLKTRETEFKKELTTFKNSITSNFKHDVKTEGKKEEGIKKTRKLFKE